MSKMPDFNAWPIELLIEYKTILDQLLTTLAPALKKRRLPQMTDLQYLLGVKNGQGMIRLPEYSNELVEDRWEPAPEWMSNPNCKTEEVIP